jgi:prophage DNA circulation protein
MSKQNDSQAELAAAIREVAKAIAIFAEVMADRPRPELYAAVEKASPRVAAALQAQGVLKPSANEVSLRTEPDVKAELTYEANIKPIAQRVLVDKGREALLNLLEGFQVKSATKLPPSEFEAFYAAAEKALA